MGLMAKVLREETPAARARQLRHTLVQARDGRHFRVLTFKLYDADPPLEFHRYETNVQECDERGKFRVLVQPLLKRFYREEHALRFHEQLLQHFDRVLGIREEAEGHKTDESSEAPAAH